MALTQKELVERSNRACRTIVDSDEFSSAETVALYRAIEGEVQTDEIFEEATSKGKRALYPRVEPGNKNLVFCEVTDLDDMPPGTWKIPEPPESARICPISEADLVVTPGVAFDRGGARLGQGGGFYDRMFKRLKPRAVRMGIAFDLQIVEQIPMGPHDEYLDCLATESGMLRFNRLGGEL